MASNKDSERPRLIPSVRFFSALLVSFALFVQYSQRVGLSMAIVCMVDRTGSRQNFNTTVLSNGTSTAQSNVEKIGNSLLDDRRFKWTEFEEQILLGAYWFGYIFTLVPGGSLSIHLGPKKTFGISIFLGSIVTVGISVIYWLDSFSWYIALLFRIVTGFVHGPLFPATYTFWSLWAVPLEKSTLAAIGFCSTNLGTSITMLLGGISCQYLNSGWIPIFLITGLIGFVWFILWMIVVADSPAIHRFISDKERRYICDNLGITKNAKKKSASLNSVPWKDIVRTPSIIALFITEFCNLFGLFFFYTNVGKIMTQVHGVRTKDAGYVLCIGFILMPVFSLSSGIIADHLNKRKILSLTTIRKIFNSIASFVPAICVIILCFCDQSRQIYGIITILVLLASSATAYGSGYIVNFADIMPKRSSIVFGVATAIATAGALGGNIIAGLIIKKPVIEDWRKLFIIFAVIYTIGGLAFLLFGSAEPCTWDKPETNDNRKKPEQTTTEEENILMETKVET